MNSNAFELDLTPLSPVSGHLSQLRTDGWTVTDGFGSVTVTLDAVNDPTAALRQLDPLVPAALNIEAVGLLGGCRLVVRLVRGTLEVFEPFAADPREVFDTREAQDDAAAAINRDVEAALRLPMRWHISGSFAFANLLAEQVRESVTVSLSAAAITQHIQQVKSKDANQLVRAEAHTILVALDTTESVQLGLLVLAGVPGQGMTGGFTVRPASMLAGELAAGSLPPAALLPDDSSAIPEVWGDAAAHVRAVAAQLVWRALATSEVIENSRVVLTFVGYKRTEFVLPETGSWEEAHVIKALGLRAWALHDASPDHLLAVRQVASLYDESGTPFEHAADVQASAEIIYAGLRTDAVAEAVKSSRDAHAQAQDAARQTVKNATEMLKGVTERMLASLVAVGAVLVANAGQVLPDDVGRLLIVLVAGFLALLAAASICLEGPLLALPARELKSDLVHQAGLLTEDQRNKIDQLPSLVAARSRITMLRWVLPIAYVAFALLLVIFGHPERYN